MNAICDRWFSDLGNGQSDRVFGFAYRLAGNEQDAWDLVQEALVRAYQHGDRFHPQRPFTSWVLKIMRNVFLDKVRRYDYRNVVSLHRPPEAEGPDWTEILPGKDPDPAEEASRREEGRIAKEALASLPRPFRSAVKLREIEGMSYTEIAEISDCSVGTVRSRIHRGRSQMRGYFQNRAAVPPRPE
jgi:RNA polymerase sigma-70 factor (ECF subfamily)